MSGTFSLYLAKLSRLLKKEQPPTLGQDDFKQLLQAMQVIGHAYEDPNSFLQKVLNLLRHLFCF